jgi:hypothetical protein
MRQHKLLIPLLFLLSLVFSACSILDYLPGNPGGIYVPPPQDEDPPEDQDPDPPVEEEPYTIVQGYLREGNATHQTPYYVITSVNPGPTLMIVGGMHGDETAGYTAASDIADQLKPDRGRLVIVPRAHAEAIRTGTRETVNLPNLNRRFPLGQYPIGLTANEIWNLVLEYQPDWLIDLHEGANYYLRGTGSVGQSVIVYPTGRASADANELVQYLNSMPAVTNGKTLRFASLTYPVEGSLARKAGQDLGVPSAIVETCVKDPLARRVGFHMQAVKFIASKLGITLQ